MKFRLANIAFLSLVLLVSVSTGETSKPKVTNLWEDVFRYEGVLEVDRGERYAVFTPMRPVKLLLELEHGNRALAEHETLRCQVQRRLTPATVTTAGGVEEGFVSETLVYCQQDGGRLFVVKGFAGQKD